MCMNLEKNKDNSIRLELAGGRSSCSGTFRLIPLSMIPSSTRRERVRCFILVSGIDKKSKQVCLESY